ncbi:hypothetical protein [Anaeromicropila populeti]|uniref:Uncharacterized protein n=1 Tax=Anaeromicropila populeti TaxID=37658 RepID=A0A1I6I7P9_9FIRM|nr:hypothetical protein [Anaeromicropila populeti]SFR62733.1 hypothetical protein SAMN05661086_00518 [Anaeromicropila populeti]
MDKKNEWVLNFIEAANDKGLPVTINGVEYEAEQKVHKQIIKEKADYMSDYVTDDKGKIIELSFHEIKTNHKK